MLNVRISANSMQSRRARRCARHCEEVERGELLRADAIPQLKLYRADFSYIPQLNRVDFFNSLKEGGEIVSASVPRCVDEQPRTATQFGGEPRSYVKAVCVVEQLGYVVAMLVYDRDVVDRCDGEVKKKEYALYRLEMRISNAQSGIEPSRRYPKCGFSTDPK